MLEGDVRKRKIVIHGLEEAENEDKLEEKWKE